MRKLMLVPAFAALAAGCGSDSTTEPSVATTITVAPAATLDAIGATQIVRAGVSDQKGKAMGNAVLSWETNSPSVVVTGLGGDSASVKAMANGTASITARAGSAAGSVEVRVAQAPVRAESFAGNGQSGAAGALLGSALRVRVVDRLGVGVAGVTVTFTVQTGGGTLAAATSVTDAEGIATNSWTLGPAAGTHTLSVTFPGTTLSPLSFTAQAVGRVPGVLGLLAGGHQAAMMGTAVPVAPSVVARDEAGNPLSGITVNFVVTSGGGRTTNTSVVTGTNGVASAGTWTLGSAADANTLTAIAPGLTGPPVVMRGTGCFGGPGAAYEVTLCITTSMTPTQRAAFANAAARWATLVRNDLADISTSIPEDACGTGTPSMNTTFDDLVIFAAAVDIDGPGSVLGQAGPCFVRTGIGGLPVVGKMEFDVADLAMMETNNQLGSVILHEMGHVLGIGTLWSSKGLLQNPSSPGNTLDTFYNGSNGIVGFDAIGGNTYTGGAKVPVENTGGAGTMNGHWRESILRNELMTGYINAGQNPLSVLTVRSLTDLGYGVDPSRADAFSLALTVRAPGPENTLKMHNDLYTGPLYTVDRAGRFTRVAR
ncbi:MAG TPA: leishmanolysin-related zinc metalloendopeptidase [Longimicrobium sp.]|jgi:hypothetical protein